jgi:hypothetical protein
VSSLSNICQTSVPVPPIEQEAFPLGVVFDVITGTRLVESPPDGQSTQTSCVLVNEQDSNAWACSVASAKANASASACVVPEYIPASMQMVWLSVDSLH